MKNPPTDSDESLGKNRKVAGKKVKSRMVDPGDGPIISQQSVTTPAPETLIVVADFLNLPYATNSQGNSQ
jgi:hypothetical protein